MSLLTQLQYISNVFLNVDKTHREGKKEKKSFIEPQILGSYRHT